MGVAKEPGLYACAASLNGVTDLEDLISTEHDYVGGKYYTRFIGRLWKDRKMLRDNSPVRVANRIQQPVLLVHGELDQVVPVRHSRRMKRALNTQLSQYVELPERIKPTDLHLTQLSVFADTLLTFLADHLQKPAKTDN